MDLQQEFFKFIKQNAGADPSALRLKYAGKNPGFDVQLAILQIECRRKYASKLSVTLGRFPDFLFPTALSGEQCSSDRLARWHASLLENGCHAADLTAGLGIDALHAAAVAGEVTAIERNGHLAEALCFNARGLEVDNLTVIQGDCGDFVKEAAGKGEVYDAVFIDPARRGAGGERVFSLADCEPNVIAMFDGIRRICRGRLIVKMSPMLDLTAVARSFPLAPAHVWAVGTPTECKEVVAVVDFRDENADTVFGAVTLFPEKESVLEFQPSENSGAGEPADFIDLKEGDFLYEPYPAVMKAATNNALARRYGLCEISANTRVLFAEGYHEDFPGHVYRVCEILPFASSVIKGFARRWPVAQVAVRNFGDSAQNLAGRLKVRQGAGGVRVYGITDTRGHRILLVTEPATRS